MKRLLTIFIAILTLYTYSGISAANAEKTLGFQGQLFESNTPKTGSVNATFTFYDAITGGSVTGTPVTKTVTVSNGYFGTQFTESDTTGVDFNQQLYVEVSINGTTLSPRTTINPTVSSLKSFGTFSYASAPTVGPVGSLYFNTTDNTLYMSNGTSWSPSSPWVTVGTSTSYMGNVGIGTTTPANLLHLYATFNPNILLESSLGGTGSSGALLFKNADGVVGGIGDAASGRTHISIWTEAGTSTIDFFTNGQNKTNGIPRLRINSDGDIGIGSSTPSAKFTIVGTSGSSTDLFAIASSSGVKHVTVTAGGNVGIGTTTPGDKLVVVGTSTATAFNALGNKILTWNGSNIISINNTNANFALGPSSFTNIETATGTLNTAVGYLTLQNNTGGTGNTALGRFALSTNTHGGFNTALGIGALQLNVTGSNNTAVGRNTLRSVLGNNNTAIGYLAGDNITTGSNNLIIGYDIDAPSATASNQLNIGNLIYGTGLDGTGGTTSTGFIGIGTTTPLYKLDVFDANNAAVGRFLSNYTAWDGRKYGSAIIGYSDAVSQGAQFGYVYNPASALDSFAHITPFGTPEGEVFSITRRSRVGVGTTTPEAKFTISTNSTDANIFHFTIASSTGATTTNLFTVSNRGTVTINKSGSAVAGGPENQVGLQLFGVPNQQNTILMYANGGANNVLAGYSTAGSASVPTATLADTYLMRLQGGGYTGSTYIAKAEISLLASENWSATSTGAHILFQTTATGTTARTERMRLTGAGFLGLGTSTPSAQFTTTGTVQFASLTGAGANLVVDSLGNVTVSSDERLKNIQGDFVTSLDKIKGITPITYKWKPETGYDASSTYAGFSAQNIQAHIPEAVSTDSRGFLTLADRPILAALVNAVKEIGAWFVDGKFKVQNDVCVDDFCMTKEEFKAMMINAKYGRNIPTANTVQSAPAADPAPTATTTEENIQSDSAPAPEPVAETNLEPSIQD